MTVGYVSTCNIPKDLRLIGSKLHLNYWKKKIRRNVKEKKMILNNHHPSRLSVRNLVFLDPNAIVLLSLMVVFE